MIDIRATLLPVFLEEAIGHLAVIDRGIGSLDRGEEDKASLEAAFRSAHTIRGTAALVRLREVKAVAERLEEELEKILHRDSPLSKETGDALCFALARLESMIAAVQSGRPEPEGAALEVDEVFTAAAQTRLQTLQPGGTEEPVAGEDEGDVDGAENRRQEAVCCRFHSLGREYALLLGQMIEITELPGLTPLPLAPSYLAGLTCLRGSVLPVIALGNVGSAAPCRSNGRYLVIGESGGERLAFLADGIPHMAVEFGGDPVDVGRFIESYRVRGN